MYLKGLFKKIFSGIIMSYEAVICSFLSDVYEKRILK